ncbi:M48 family metallopeptidase [Salinimicrobium sediminilitoris]|uniref:M48 family metallopeptidase n=1 Tax=Salinimicrobium sediminilitoris TaxID=2876715 RepID=UPI001E50A640|nr:M48 family metallopeptidase [Salinimicrobium sediminilitoris]MCC8359113.1 M48 family metalloprotease [Salinimicrobium sediminilitoris]
MKLRQITIMVSLVLLMAGCKTNPFTGERNLNFVSNSQIFPAAFQQYEEVLKQNEIVRNTSEANMIKNVGRKVAVAAERFLDANGYQGYLNDYEWEFNLIKDDDQVNAWAMPGGKIAFYTGIMPIAKDETGVAAIMAHEVAHAVANHGAQRMSAAQLQQVGGAVVGAAVGGRSESTQQIIAQAYGLGTNLGGMLPFSRSHESEADRIGLTLMAMAGYDPAEAANLWRRMEQNSGGQAPPEFLSTHPNPQTRIKNIEKWAPQAKAEARKYGVTSFQ